MQVTAYRPPSMPAPPTPTRMKPAPSPPTYPRFGKSARPPQAKTASGSPARLKPGELAQRKRFADIMRGVRDRLFRSSVRRSEPAELRKMQKQVGEILGRIRVRNIAPVKSPPAPVPNAPVQSISHPGGGRFSARA